MTTNNDLITVLSDINNYKDANNWGLMFDCPHVTEFEEFYVQFLETEFMLCVQCIHSLWVFVQEVMKNVKTSS